MDSVFHIDLDGTNGHVDTALCVLVRAIFGISDYRTGKHPRYVSITCIRGTLNKPAFIVVQEKGSPSPFCCFYDCERYQMHCTMGMTVRNANGFRVGPNNLDRIKAMHVFLRGFIPSDIAKSLPAFTD